MRDVLIQAENLTKIYGEGENEVRAVNDVSLTLSRNEIILIIGPSGSGKTTLLSMLGCILTPTLGKLVVKGTDTSRLSEKGFLKLRREEIGFVFQAFNLFENLTAEENLDIIYDIHNRKRDGRALEYLRKVGLEHRRHHLPRNLSIGEKQRVAISRALMNSPDIILADEPTGNLDSKTGYAVTELLVKLAKEENKGVIIVTHDVRLKDIPDKIIHIEDGCYVQGKGLSL
jgi:putative ABC transport system ATP-binding protein